MDYFNYQKIAVEAKIPKAKLKELEGIFCDEFSHDPMMAELHVLRACMAIRDGYLTFRTPDPCRGFNRSKELK